MYIMFKSTRINVLIYGIPSFKAIPAMKSSSHLVNTLAPTLSASILYKVATATLAFLLVACAAGGGGSGGGGSTAGGTQVSAFSHNSYAFAADLADNDVLDATPQVVGRVLINNNRIRSLVAARSGITDPQLISALGSWQTMDIVYL